MDPIALLNYFDPIIQWLEADKAENKWVTGWGDDFDKAWKPCGYDEKDTATYCTDKLECSTEEDWDPSWGPEEDLPEEGSAQVSQ